MNLIGTAVFAGRLLSLGLKADKALAIAATVVELIHDAEALANEVKAAPKTVEGVVALAGSDKLAAVKDGVWAALIQLGLNDEAEKIWAAIYPRVNLLVRVYRAVGLFAK